MVVAVVVVVVVAVVVTVGLASGWWTGGGQCEDLRNVEVRAERDATVCSEVIDG